MCITTYVCISTLLAYYRSSLEPSPSSPPLHARLIGACAAVHFTRVTPSPGSPSTRAHPSSRLVSCLPSLPGPPYSLAWRIAVDLGILVVCNLLGRIFTSFLYISSDLYLARPRFVVPSLCSRHPPTPTTPSSLCGCWPLGVERLSGGHSGVRRTLVQKYIYMQHLSAKFVASPSSSFPLPSLTLTLTLTLVFDRSALSVATCLPSVYSAILYPCITCSSNASLAVVSISSPSPPSPPSLSRFRFRFRLLSSLVRRSENTNTARFLVLPCP